MRAVSGCDLKSIEDAKLRFSKIETSDADRSASQRSDEKLNLV